MAAALEEAQAQYQASRKASGQVTRCSSAAADGWLAAQQLRRGRECTLPCWALKQRGVLIHGQVGAA